MVHVFYFLNGDAASKSLLVYTFVSSPSKEITFQWGQIQTPFKCLFHFNLFSFAAYNFYDLYNVSYLITVELKTQKQV